MTRKNAHGLDPLTDAMVEGAAQELHHLASRGQSWPATHHELKQEFRTIARRVMGAAQTSEVAARSKRRGVLPPTERSHGG
jgi:hypothetical protein